MKLLGFDIETYREHFCFVGKMYDTDTKTEVDSVTVTDNGGCVDRTRMAIIEHYFDQADYIVSFNGKAFDLPVLAKLKSELERAPSIPVKFIYHDAQALISYDEHNNPLVKRRHKVRAWSAKHFDVFANCLLRYSLKQWEMYEGLRIRELPYSPDEHLTDEMKKNIDDYCAYDVYAMMQIFWIYGWDTPKANRTTLLAVRELFKWWPADMPLSFDQQIQAICGGIIYHSYQPIAPKEVQPLKLFDLNDFKVPLDVKVIMAYFAKNPTANIDGTYKGISYGRGGAHFIREGHYKNIYAFDFASMYAFIIGHWQLLKTKSANDIYAEKRDYRLEVKHKKEGDPMLINVDRALKLFLNAPTGALRMRAQYNVMFDPAAGEAMCYIGQLLISELAFACPEFENLLEINTDSVFVRGEANIKACRDMIDYFKDKYGLTLEEEYIPEIYIRDVNNYIIYDENGQVTSGKGQAYADITNKNSNIAMYDCLFRSVISDKPQLVWDKHPWQDFVVKYHRSAASKYAMINNEPMRWKNYYFMWTTEDCPDAVPISFSRELIDRKSGAIKARFGVWSQDMPELEKYAKYIDLSQYRRDLDAELWLWGRPDLCETHLSKIQRRGVKSLKDLIQRDFI
jgi:hypothetical protein